MDTPAEPRNSVSGTVWCWREATASATPPARWRRVLTRCAIGLLVAAALSIWFPRLASVAVVATVLLATLGLAAPAAHGRLDAVLAWLGRTVGFVLTGLLLGLLFLLWFVPCRFLLLLRRRDPLRRRFPATDASFWVPYGPAPDRSHYGRQSR
jgi:hypothetical protein